MGVLIALVDVKRAKEIGLNLDTITSPYNLWDNEKMKGHYVIFSPSELGDEMYKKMARKPDYKEIQIACGN